MRVAVVVAFALLACRSRAEVRPDPARVDAAPDTAIESRARVVRGGEIIDVGAGRLSHVLRDAPPVAEVNDERRAYLFGKDFVLRAFELSDGKEAWSRKIPTTLRPLVMDDAFVYVIGDSVVTAANKKTGDLRTIAVSKPIARASAASRKLVVARNDRVVEVFDPNDASGHGVTAATLAFDPIGYHAGLATLSDGVTVCAFASDPRLQIQCFDTNGTPKARATHDLSLPTAPAGASFGIKAVDDRYVLFGRHPSSSLRRSLIVRLSDGSVVARVEDDVAAIVKREDGSIAGLLVIGPELRLLDTTGAVRWTAKRAAGHHESASAVARGNALFIATYPEFSSGSDLAAYDLATGKPLWKGAVELLPIGHSEYFNEVTLSIVSDRLLLRGDESGVITTQLFDLVNGNRLLAVSHHR